MISILIAGDFCPRRRVDKLINRWNYSVFDEIKQYTNDSDYSIVNLEAPVVESKANTIEKTGPNLKCNKNAIEAIKYAGFDCVTLANNHFYDYGEEGVKDTLNTCNDYNIDFIGGGKNIEDAQKVIYKKIKNHKISFLSFCENEWSIATETTGGSAPLNPIKNYYQIQEAKNNSDYVIVIIHGGVEGYQLPTPRMKDVYRFFIDSGADVVVNHHQHCYSGYEIYKNKPIFYGLGNFCFDWQYKELNWYKGFMLNLFFDEKISYDIVPYIQCDKIPKVEILTNKDKDIFINSNLEKLNFIIKNDRLVSKYYKELIDKRTKSLDVIFEPYMNKYLCALRNKNMIPSFISKKHKRYLLNIIRCESYMDILLNVLNKHI